jgi:protein-disulfide isomerase/uncharacterized membrane protein
MRRKALIVVVVAAVCGATLSALSTSQYLRIQREGLEQKSFCAISETINCDVVNASSYAEFLGVPNGWWGLVFYLLIGGMALFAALSSKNRRATVALAWFMSLGGLAYAAYLAYIAAFVLGVLCLECLGMYLVNIIFVIFLFLALRIPVKRVGRFVADYVRAVFGRPSGLGFSPRLLRHVAVVAVAFAVGWFIIAHIQAKEVRKARGPSVDEKVRAFYMQSLYMIDVDPNWAVWGNPEAKVTIVEFSEYQCPFCRLAAFNIKPYLQEFKDDVRYYYVNYPLDNACNPYMTRPMHPLACFAGKAGICAEKRGDFWSFHDDMFRNQRKLSRNLILSLASKRGWDRDEFLACVDSPETDAQIRKEIEVAKRIYVRGTPSLFLDNRKLRYWRDPKFLQAVVREEIKRAKKGERSKK